MSGIGGESGRQDDITAEHAQKKSVRLVHNLCEALAQVLSMGLRILDTIPGALPITARATVIKNGEPITEEYKVTKEDIGGYYGCTVKLNPEEAIEHDRKVMLGRTLVNEGRISWELFLIDYMGMTKDEADKTISDAIAEQAILNDPTMSQIRVMEAIEQAGMTRYLEKIQQTQQAPPPQIRPSEAKNPVARETIRQALGEKGVARTPPEGNR